MKKYTISKIKKILNEYEQIKSTKPILEKYHIVKSTLFNWQREFKKRQSGHYTINSYSAHDINNMRRQLKMLKENNDILTQAGCSINSSTEDKINAVKKLLEKYTVTKICNVLKLAKSTYYRRVASENKKTSYQKADNELKPLIKKYFDLSKERFGGSKIRIMLMQYHKMKVSKERIQRLMREMNLITKQARGIKERKIKTKNEKLPNFIHRNFSTLKPNQVWVSDITYLPVENKHCYMCVIMDLFSRKVLAYKVSRNEDPQLVLDTFTEAYQVRQPTDLIFHSDRGVQYKSRIFTNALEKLHVVQSFSRTGCPLDNAVIEGFFSVMKREEISHHYYDSLAMLDRYVNEYVCFYNDMRPMKILNDHTPSQYEELYGDFSSVQASENLRRKCA